MTAALRSTAGLVWAVLVAATCVSWWLGTDHGLDDRTAAAVVIVVVAFAKVHLVGRWFMELHGAVLPLRRAFDAYVAVVCAVLVGLLVAL
jgi:hypothetical protein